MSDQSMALIKRTLNSTEIMTRFAALMGERQATYYINSVILAVANSKDLQECTPNSIVFSALRAASLKLSCDPALGEAYMVPFKNGKTGDKEAVFIPGYKGLRNMATRTNKYRYINAGKLRNGEQWVEDQLTGKCSIAGKAIDNTKIGWFAFFEMYSGYSKGLFMTTEEIHDHAAKFSKTYNSANSKWKTDPESMEKKTILRLLLVRWGDLGEAGNAFVEDEIIDGDFHVNLEAHDEDSGNGHHDKDQVLHDLYGDPIPPEHDAEPPIEQHATATDEVKPWTKEEIYTKMVEAGVSSSEFAAKGALAKCLVDWNTPAQALAWLKIYRPWREAGLNSTQAAEKANAGEMPK